VPLTPGTRLGPYEVLAAVGAGGMGEVFKARDTRLDRFVAIKILPAALAADPEFRERFDREARAISHLTHPHICTLYDVGEEAGTAYLVMEYLEGETLAIRLERGALPLHDALTTAIQIASALDKAHRARITHRDLKPGNVMLTRSGAKLLDFGLAKTAGPVAGGAALSMPPTVPAQLTMQGTILGTLQYMAPEQVEGREADARTDIFALGVVLYEMLTGKKAFDGRSQASLMAAILEHEPSPVSALRPVAPPTLDLIVKTCLAKDPDERWQTAADIGRQLTWIVEGRLASPAEAATKPTRRPARTLIAGAALVLALALFVVSPIVVDHLREPAGQPSPVRFNVPLPDGTSFSGGPPGISVSPDGRSVAFTAQTAGMTRIWLHRFDEVGSQPLLGTEGADTGEWPIWSPDSQSVAFVADQRGTLKRIDVAGGPATNIGPLRPTVGNSPGGTWNRDGEILLAGATGGILRVSAMTGQFVPVTFEPKLTGLELSPVFLPDGRRFLYTRQGGSEPGVYVGSLDSDETQILLPNGSTAQISEGFVLYSRGGTVMAQPFDARNGSVTGEPAVVVDNVPFAPRSGRAGFSVSGNGVLAYGSSGDSGNRQLTWFSRSGEPLGTIGEVGVYSSISISPDERKVVTSRSDQNGIGNLWVTELDRQVATRITFGRDVDREARWSPDGKRLIYTSLRAGDQSLYEVPATGGSPRLVLKSPEGHQLAMQSWSPDGRTVLYTSLTPSQLWAFLMEGDQKPALVYEAAGGTGAIEAAFSPDGKWIAFSSSESGRAQVYVIPFPPTGEKWQVSANGGGKPSWRRDGRELYFLAQETMMAADVRPGDRFEVGTPHALFQTNTVPGSTTSLYIVTGDGQRFLVIARAGTAQSDAIQVITGWPGLLTGR